MRERIATEHDEPEYKDDEGYVQRCQRAYKKDDGGYESHCQRAGKGMVKATNSTTSKGT